MTLPECQHLHLWNGVKTPPLPIMHCSLVLNTDCLEMLDADQGDTTVRENLVQIPHFAEEEPEDQRMKVACPHDPGNAGMG